MPPLAATFSSATFLADGGQGRVSSLSSQPARPVTVSSPAADATLGQVADRVNLSSEAIAASWRASVIGSPSADVAEDGVLPRPDSAAEQEQGDAKGSGAALSRDELQMVRELKQRDREVRTHEQAHLATAGQYARGGASYTYQQGPDGRRYAVGGEVPIDVGKEKTPEQTMQKMRAVRSAALAPANPSSADRQIAAAASRAEAEARQELQAAQQRPAGEQASAGGSESGSERPPVEPSPSSRRTRSPQLDIAV